MNEECKPNTYYVDSRLTQPSFKDNSVLYWICTVQSRPARIAELPRSKFDPELFPHSAYVEIFVTFATFAVFNILQQNVMHFDVGNGKRGRKWRKREEIERE